MLYTGPEFVPPGCRSLATVRMNSLASLIDTREDLMNCKELRFVGAKGVEAQASLTPHACTYCTLCQGSPRDIPERVKASVTSIDIMTSYVR